MQRPRPPRFAWRSLSLLAILVALGCQGEVDGELMDPDRPPVGPDGGPIDRQDASPDMPPPVDRDMSQGDMDPPDLGPGDPANAGIYLRLRPSCVGCHGPGTSWPAFDTLAAFENLLVYNPTWITLGSADTSRLFPMLGGRGEGSLMQMPLGAMNFEQLEAAGQTQITVQELRDWVDGLTPRNQPERAPIPTLRFKRAEQIVRALYDQLGLTPEDFFNNVTETEHSRPRQDRYPVAIPEDREVRYDNANLSYARWNALGGGSYLRQTVATQTPTIARAMTLTQMSQSWCRVALQKQGNTAVLRFATLAQDSQSASDDIRRNIDYLHLRMLGEPATPERQQALFDLFVAYEAFEGGTETAWVAVCSSLIRDPMWIAY